MGPLALELVVDADEVGGSGDTDIDFGPGLGRDDVGVRASVDGSYVDGQATLEVGAGFDGGDLAGQLGDGGVALLEVDAAVGRDSCNVDAIIGDSLARGLVGSVESLCRFEDVDGFATSGGFFEPVAGGVTAGFFVAGEKQDDGAVWEAFGFQDFDGGEGHGDSGFHIEHAGAAGAAFFDFEGHLGKRAERPYGVEMAEEEDGFFGAALGVAETGFEDVSRMGLTMAADGGSEAGGGLSGEVYAAVEGGLFSGFFSAGGLKFDKSLEEVEKRFFAAPRCPQEAFWTVSYCLFS